MTNPEDIIPTKVLIVDDNDQNVELLQAYMDDIPGVSTMAARDGVEALHAVAREKPDLILLDIMMPKMSGYEVCKQLKAERMTRDIPIIMITALNEPSDYEHSMDSGADDCLTRPLNRVEFIARIRSMLRIRQMRRESQWGDSSPAD